MLDTVAEVSPKPIPEIQFFGKNHRTPSPLLAYMVLGLLIITGVVVSPSKKTTGSETSMQTGISASCDALSTNTTEVHTRIIGQLANSNTGVEVLRETVNELDSINDNISNASDKCSNLAPYSGANKALRVFAKHILASKEAQ